jgi:hypothetical protein
MTDREKIEEFLERPVDVHDEVTVDDTLDSLEAMVRAVLGMADSMRARKDETARPMNFAVVAMRTVLTHHADEIEHRMAKVLK